MKKAQLLSLDFLMAAVIFTMALGIFVYNTDLVKRNLQFQSELYTNNADAIAELIASDQQAKISTSWGLNYCTHYSIDAPNSCVTDFNCEKRVFSATRFVLCPSDNTKSCVLMVKTCE